MPICCCTPTTPIAPSMAAARSWWQDCLSGQESVGFTHPTLFAFLRISTNARIYADPMDTRRIGGTLCVWLARRVSQVLQAPADHVHQVVALLESAVGPPATWSPTRRSRAGALTSRVVHTADRDFLRFPRSAADSPWTNKSSSIRPQHPLPKYQQVTGTNGA